MFLRHLKTRSEHVMNFNNDVLQYYNQVVDITKMIIAYEYQVQS